MGFFAFCITCLARTIPLIERSPIESRPGRLSHEVTGRIGVELANIKLCCSALSLGQVLLTCVIGSWLFLIFNLCIMLEFSHRGAARPC